MADVEKMIDSMRAMAREAEIGVLPESSRQQLLQAAKELQYSTETPSETCNRYRYSVGILIFIALLFNMITLNPPNWGLLV